MAYCKNSCKLELVWGKQSIWSSYDTCGYITPSCGYLKTLPTSRDFHSMKKATSGQKVTPNTVIAFELMSWRSNKKPKTAEQTATLFPSQSQGWKLGALPHPCLEEEGVIPLIPYPDMSQRVYSLNFHNNNSQHIPFLQFSPLLCVFTLNHWEVT